MNKSFSDQNDFVNYVQSITRTRSQNATPLTVKFCASENSDAVQVVTYNPVKKAVLATVMSLEEIRSLKKENEELKAIIKEMKPVPGMAMLLKASMGEPIPEYMLQSPEETKNQPK